MRRLVFLFVFMTALAWGQAIDDFAWWDSPIAQNLNLSPDQQKQIRATVREFRDRLIDQRAATRKAEANLMDLMNDEQVNEAKSKDAIDKLVVARGDLMRSLSQMSLRLRMVLTPQQWQELQRRRAQRVPQGRGPIAPGERQQLQQRLQQLGQRLQGRGGLDPAKRQQIQQRLQQLNQRLQQGGELAPAERQQMLELLRQMEQSLQEGGAPPPVAPAKPQPGGPPQPPRGAGQPF